ncbi:MAG: iron uptake transporter deferrochelatase/peroxidase subunit [Solirubrobacteraceae bacterium]
MGSTRRRFLAGSAGAGLGAALGAAGAGVARAAESSVPAGRVPFYGRHQAGIATPSQEHLQFAAFDMVSDSVDDLHQLLRTWSAAAAAIAEGRPVGPLDTGARPPVDTGETVGLGPSKATVTFGLGPGIFRKGRHDRFGLARRRPAPLVNLPRFPTDWLQPSLSGGDLAVQACADDPQVAFHALHDLIRLARHVAVPRWTVAGFGRTANTPLRQTPRNLMGFKDGTANIVSDDHRALRRFVWASGRESPAWMHGGSYMVVRRIRIMLAKWDGESLNRQQASVGRYKLSGAPLSGQHEHDPVDLGAMHNGSLVVPFDSHVRRASPAYSGGERILRRGYSFVDGLDPHDSSPKVGLFFICFQRDPRAQFIPIQRRLSRIDALNPFTRHEGSAIFACPPGASRGGFVGEGLFG